MSLNNQNRLEKAFSELPTRLKFRSLVESGVKTNQIDPLIVKSFDKTDFPVIKELLRKYLDLPFLYYEKLWLNQRLMIYDTREAWKMQTKMTLSALRLALSYVDILTSLNKSLGYKDLESYCRKKQTELLSLITHIEELLKNIEGIISRKPEFQSVYDETVEKINKIEYDLGFVFPQKDEFL